MTEKIKQDARAFFGTSYGADFSAGHWTFVMKPGYRVSAGEFAVMPRESYEALVTAIQRLCRSFPTDTDMQELRWEPGLIDEACNAYDAARAAIAKTEAA